VDVLNQRIRRVRPTDEEDYMTNFEKAYLFSEMLEDSLAELYDEVRERTPTSYELMLLQQWGNGRQYSWAKAQIEKGDYSDADVPPPADEAGKDDGFYPTSIPTAEEWNSAFRGDDEEK
jgi:hypothetical protein